MPPSLRCACCAALGASTLLLSSCASSADDTHASGTVRVVASTNVYGDIVRQIGGNDVSVTSIISNPAQDPHSYQASTKNQLALSRAAVVVENGGGYDDFVDTMLDTAKNPSARVINAVTVSGRKAPAHGELNEHVWYDLPAMGRLADRISSTLGTADPAHAATYTANARAFTTKLKKLEHIESDIASAHHGDRVAITEPVPLYLLRAAGLRDATPEAFSEAVEEGDAVSPSVLRDTLALFRDTKVRALVHNTQTSGPATEKVTKAAKAADVPVVGVTETLPDGTDYLGWMRHNLTALNDALEDR